MELVIDPKDGEITLTNTFTLSSEDIASLITFDNSHIVAQLLISNPETARAIYNELEYWADNNQI